MTRERVLLTGASGLLGSHALDFILDNTDWDIVCPVSFQHNGVFERINATLSNAHARDRDRVTLVRCDLASPVNFTTRYQFGAITHIINFASSTNIAASIEDPVSIIQNNIYLMMYLLEYARSLDNLAAFVQVGTNEIYEPKAFGAISEWDVIVPGTPYSATKSSQEMLAISYWRTYNVPVVFINTMNIFGEMQDPVKYIPQLIRRIKANEVVKIYCDDQMKPMTQVYLHAREVASAILFLLRRGVPTHLDDLPSSPLPKPDRWHVSGHHEYDGVTVADLVADIMDHRFQYELTPVPQRGRCVLDNTKITTLGWTQLRPFSTSLERVVKWTLDHPMWLGESRES